VVVMDLKRTPPTTCLVRSRAAVINDQGVSILGCR
jgi:hypothetical protein